MSCQHTGGTEVQLHAFLTLGLHWRRVVNTTPQLLYPLKITLVHTGQEAMWAPQPVWMFWRSEKFAVPARIQTLDRPVHNPVSLPPTLPQLKFKI
jgi:hypothetical protein